MHINFIWAGSVFIQKFLEHQNDVICHLLFVLIIQNSKKDEFDIKTSLEGPDKNKFSLNFFPQLRALPYIQRKGD